MPFRRYLPKPMDRSDSAYGRGQAGRRAMARAGARRSSQRSRGVCYLTSISSTQNINPLERPLSFGPVPGPKNHARNASSLTSHGRAQTHFAGARPMGGGEPRCPRKGLDEGPRRSIAYNFTSQSNPEWGRAAVMANLSPAKVIRRVRKSLELSQEALSRLLSATKGAVQHWERGRNNPDLARLLALRQLCSPGAERRELDALVKQAQSQVAPLPTDKLVQGAARAKRGRAIRGAGPYPIEGLTMLRRENRRFQRQIAKLEATLQRRSGQLRILEDLATDLQRQLSKLKANQPTK